MRFAFGVVPPLVTCGKNEHLSISEGLTNGSSLFSCPPLAAYTNGIKHDSTMR
jgi:hypothetical protein